MALIKCNECEKEVSTNASKCPNCGNPLVSDKEKEQIKAKEEQPRGGPILQIIAFIATGFVLFIIAGANISPYVAVPILLLSVFPPIYINKYNSQAGKIISYGIFLIGISYVLFVIYVINFK